MDIRKLTSSLKWEFLFQVRGHDLDGLIDMMRYDRVTPATQSDVSLMNRLQFQDRLNAGDLEDVVITMKTFSELKSWSPTVDRWRSYGWIILDDLRWQPEECSSEFELAKAWLRDSFDLDVYASGLQTRINEGESSDEIFESLPRDPFFLLVCRLNSWNPSTQVQSLRECVLGLEVDGVGRFPERKSS